MQLNRSKLTLKTTLTSGVCTLALLLPTYAVADQDKGQSLQQDIKQMSAESQQYFQNGWREGKIETSYLFSEHLNNFDIDVEVNDKQAVLKGNVSSEVEKELAQEIALSVDGIEDVENRISVSPDTKKSRDKQNENYLSAVEDATITAHVKTRLLTEGEVPGLQINVDTDNGKVTLEGEVDSEAVKELAGKIAENTRNVESVDNQLEVQS